MKKENVKLHVDGYPFYTWAYFLIFLDIAVLKLVACQWQKAGHISGMTGEKNLQVVFHFVCLSCSFIHLTVKGSNLAVQGQNLFGLLNNVWRHVFPILSPV